MFSFLDLFVFCVRFTFPSFFAFFVSRALERRDVSANLLGVAAVDRCHAATTAFAV
jgi:hypothetical protein